MNTKLVSFQISLLVDFRRLHYFIQVFKSSIVSGGNFTKRLDSSRRQAKLLFFDYAGDCIKRRSKDLKPGTIHSYEIMNGNIKDQIGYFIEVIYKEMKGFVAEDYLAEQ